ncbi:MAG TPA: sigma-70 family RNA polymerase sigma factor [Candidatus Dormibacteraeota bacterium]|nr:sigma-70 family RNA polymerase sigma factor [Candidatus Dormibacteraeota bacterium]
MRDAAEVRDELLLERVAVGDEEAFRALYRRHQGSLYRYALHMTGRPEAAEEVVQEVFMGLIRGPVKFDAERGPLGAFLFGIARNRVRRLLEADRRLVAMPEEWPEGLSTETDNVFGRRTLDAADHLARAEMNAQVRKAVLSLPERYREVVTLCDLEELAYEQAALILNCPVGTVRSRLNRARGMLAEKLTAALAPKPAVRVRVPRVADAG